MRSPPWPGAQALVATRLVKELIVEKGGADRHSRRIRSLGRDRRNPSQADLRLIGGGPLGPKGHRSSSEATPGPPGEQAAPGGALIPAGDERGVPPLPARQEPDRPRTGHRAGPPRRRAARPHQVKIGYARVSTGGQKPERQLDALTAAGCRKVFADKKSGKNALRPELEPCHAFLDPGDTLVVPSLHRYGRSLQDLINMVAELRTRGVGFTSLHESLDTTTPGGRLVFHALAALAASARPAPCLRTSATHKTSTPARRRTGQSRPLSRDLL
ncbi:DNA invertase [Streptomyces hygroscopicus subsp. limoneus]|nr:DNA invertase [Streptomyces hygroscopicus subsp. limoneus]